MKSEKRNTIGLAELALAHRLPFTCAGDEGDVHPTSGTREDRCETTDTADWPAAYVRSPGRKSQSLPKLHLKKS